MAYEPYATPDYYRQEYCGKIVPEDELEKALRQASRHIDSLTYNRIAGREFSNLTSFQQDLILMPLNFCRNIHTGRIRIKIQNLLYLRMKIFPL